MIIQRALVAALLCSVALAAHAQQLTVSAAASLTEALREIATRFESGRPGVTVRLNFAASGPLLQQIVQGAPADVFVSADEETVTRGVQARVLDAASRRVFAANVLVLIRPIIAPPKDAPDLASPADLVRPEFKRIAIGKPATVPAGRYTQQALVAAGVWESLQAKLVPSDSVRQVLDYVSRGEAEAGFVYRTDAALMATKVQVVGTVGGHVPIRYPAVVVSASPLKALAGDFVAFLSGPVAQGILARRGFSAP